MPESTIVRTKRDGQILLADSGAANTYTLVYEPGDFSYDVADTTVINPLDRGEFGATPQLRKGDDQPMTGGFSAYFRDPGDLSDAYATLLDIAHQYAGRFVDSNWVSTHGTNGDVFTITIQYTIDGSAFGEADKTLTFAFCVIRAGMSEGDPGAVTVTWTSYTLRPTLS